MTQVATVEKEVTRPLKVLVPLIKHELEEGNQAGLAHYRRAGEMLIEAKNQVPHGEWLGWLDKNFHLGAMTAQVYMRLARESKDEIKNPAGKVFRNLSEVVGDRRPSHEPAWSEPVKKVLADPALITRITRDTQTKMDEAKLTHELAFKLIDIGYKVLATKLHPDRGGSKDSMERLNRVRDQLKKAVKHIGIH
jgi:hypothetical protein